MTDALVTDAWTSTTADDARSVDEILADTERIMRTMPRLDPLAVVADPAGEQRLRAYCQSIPSSAIRPELAIAPVHVEPDADAALLRALRLTSDGRRVTLVTGTDVVSQDDLQAYLDLWLADGRSL